MNTRCTLIVVALSCSALALGCGEGGASTPDDTRHFKAVGVMYGQYLSSHAGKQPPSVEKLREFVEKRGGRSLKQFGLASVGELFVSPRDGQPLVWVLKGTGTNRVIAYEELGLNGSRIVITALGAVEELSEKDFRTRVK